MPGCGEPGSFTCNKNGATSCFLHHRGTEPQRNSLLFYSFGFLCDSVSLWWKRSFALNGYHGRLVLLVRSLEISDLVIALEVPDAGGDLIDQIMVVRH